MKTKQQNKKARNEKAASILRTVDNKDLAKVAGGIGFCFTCGTATQFETPAQLKTVAL